VDKRTSTKPFFQACGPKRREKKTQTNNQTMDPTFPLPPLSKFAHIPPFGGRVVTFFGAHPPQIFVNLSRYGLFFSLLFPSPGRSGASWHQRKTKGKIFGHFFLIKWAKGRALQRNFFPFVLSPVVVFIGKNPHRFLPKGHGHPPSLSFWGTVVVLGGGAPLWFPGSFRPFCPHVWSVKITPYAFLYNARLPHAGPGVPSGTGPNPFLFPRLV